MERSVSLTDLRDGNLDAKKVQPSLGIISKYERDAPPEEGEHVFFPSRPLGCT